MGDGSIKVDEIDRVEILSFGFESWILSRYRTSEHPKLAMVSNELLSISESDSIYLSCYYVNNQVT